MQTVLAYAKALIAAIAAAAIAALAGVDWQAVLASALASGGGVAVTPNRKRKNR